MLEIPFVKNFLENFLKALELVFWVWGGVIKIEFFINIIFT